MCTFYHWVEAGSHVSLAAAMPGLRLQRVIFHQCIQIGPQVTANDLTKAGVPYWRLSQSWRLVVEVPAKSMSEYVVAASQPPTVIVFVDCRAGTRPAAGQASAKIAADDGVTLL